MGCAESRKDENQLESDYFQPFQETLGLKKHNVKQIDRIFHRYSNNGILTSMQFKRACSCLGIPDSSLISFFENFKETDHYSVKKLTTLGVLLGSGSVTEKSLVLFENYDDNSSNSLDCCEIRKLVEDIVKISCEIIPTYVYKKNLLDEDLREYFREIRIVSSFMIQQNLELLSSDQAGIRKERFLICAEKFAENFFVPGKIRKKSFEIFQKVLKPVQKFIDRYDYRTLRNSQVYKELLNDSSENNSRVVLAHSKTI